MTTKVNVEEDYLIQMAVYPVGLKFSDSRAYEQFCEFLKASNLRVKAVLDGDKAALEFTRKEKFHGDSRKLPDTGDGQKPEPNEGDGDT